jgi:hypothetical protein
MTMIAIVFAVSILALSLMEAALIVHETIRHVPIRRNRSK